MSSSIEDAVARCRSAHQILALDRTLNLDNIQHQLQTVLKVVQGQRCCTGQHSCACKLLSLMTKVACSPPWDAAQPGYSKVHTDVVAALPALGAVLPKADHPYAARP